MKFNFLIFILGIFFNSVSAQFKTITYTAPTTIEKKENSVSAKNEKEIEEKKEPKKGRKIFNYTTKSELKKEIDSLKKMIHNINAEKKNTRQQLELKTLEEALANALRKSFQQTGSLQSVKKYDYVEEYYAPAVKVSMPINGKLRVTSPFGVRTHPIYGGKKMHNGIDLGANYENVFAVLDGVVTEAGWDNKGGGNYIKVRHSDRFETSYLHLSEMYYRAGDSVKAGYIIGKSGNSGNSTGPHLHFAVKEFGQFINPVKFLNDLVFANNLMSK